MQPCGDCGHALSIHDTGWDAAGCMVNECSCRFYCEPKAASVLAMSETPQEILGRAAPIWDKHVVSFTLVLAALRATLAERDDARNYTADIAAGICHYPHGEGSGCVRCERDTLRQTSGDLCDKCGWRGVRGDEACAFCERDALRAEVKRLDAGWREANIQTLRNGLSADKAEAALRGLLSYVGQLELLAYQIEEVDVPHATVANARAALRDTAPEGFFARGEDGQYRPDPAPADHLSTEAEALAVMGDGQALTKVRIIGP